MGWDRLENTCRILPDAVGTQPRGSLKVAPGLVSASMTDPAALPNFGPASFPVSPSQGSAEWTSADPASVDVRADAELPLRERVLRALAGGGYQATLDDDGDVEVSVQEQKLFVRCVDTVPPLMRVFGQWLMDDLPADELDRLRAANAVTAAVNLAKATVHGDRLEVAVDLLAGDDFHLPSLLDASMDAVLGCVRSWHATVLDLGGHLDM